MRVERGHEKPVAEDAEALVDQSAAGRQAGRRQLASVPPDLTSGPRIERPRVVVRAGDVQDAIEQQRRRLESAELLGLEDPLLCRRPP
jgi:hypothetical protein